MEIDAVEAVEAIEASDLLDLLLNFLLFVLLGVSIGTVAGLIPGLHINNLLPAILSLAAFFDPMLLAVMISAIAMTQNFVCYVTSIFVGAPDEDTALTVLPGHRLLIEGRGFEAIKLTAVSGLATLFVSIILIFILSGYYGIIYDIIRPYVQFIISGIAVVMILFEKKLRKILAASLVFIMSGFFGVLILNSPLLPKANVLFPALSGLFGLSTIMVSITQKSQIPPQTYDEEMKLSKKSLARSVLLGTFAGLIVGLLPAIGVSQAAILVGFNKISDARSFLATTSSINIANEVFSLMSLFLVGNPRSGSSVAIQQLVSELTQNDLFLFIGSICISAGLASVITVWLGKKIPHYLQRINYMHLSSAVILFLTAMVLLLTGFLGVLILFTAVSIGLLCNYLGVKRSHCMGVLLLPSILFFAGLNPFVITLLGI